MALRLILYRLPESLLEVQTSLDFTDLTTCNSWKYGRDKVFTVANSKNQRTCERINNYNKTLVNLSMPDMTFNHVMLGKFAQKYKM